MKLMKSMLKSHFNQTQYVILVPVLDVLRLFVEFWV